jgi:serine protease
VANGAVVVVAAGNSSQDAANFSPASCKGVITVAATGQTGQMAYYSNYGASVEIAAPGGDGYVDTMVLSTLNSGITAPVASSYANYQGTSMATPHVVGLVSLMLSINPSLTPAQVLTLLQQNVTPFPAGGTCTTANCGSGIANAAATLQAMQLPPPGDTAPDPFGWPTKTGVSTNTWITSAPIVLTGFDTPAPFVVDNGYLILNCSNTPVPKYPFPFWPAGSAAPSADLSSGTVAPGTSVCVKHKSSATAGGSVTSTVTIGGVVGTFTSIAKSGYRFLPFPY